MRLIEELRKRLDTEQSPVRAQLIREDLARLSKLQALALEHNSAADFAKTGLYIGWTRDDIRTHEVRDELNALMDVIHARQHGGIGEGAEQQIMDAWIAFNRARMSKLVHCL